MIRVWGAHLLGVLILAAVIVAAATQFWVATAGWGFIGYLAISLATGWFLAARLPRNPIGWLILGSAVIFALQVPLELIGVALLPDQPELAAWLLNYGHDRVDLDTWTWLPALGLLFTQIPLRFPTGRLLSPRWRWFSAYTVVALVVSTLVLSTWTLEVYPGLPNPVGLTWLIAGQPFQLLVVDVLFPTATLGSIASLILRYRRGAVQERAQIRWVAWAVPLAATPLIIDLLTPPEVPIVHDWIQIGHALIPIALMIAVLRYRLYDIDRLISRTTAYAIVTLLAVGVYALVVVSLTRLLPDLPSVGVALATLIAAALFLPALRAVQRVVDRRFDRERYDAEKVVDAFGERLRSHLDPHSTGGDLTRAVEQTLQPASVGLWTVRSRP
jgi:hypothetical protein